MNDVKTYRYWITRNGEPVDSRKTKSGAKSRAASLASSYPEYVWDVLDTLTIPTLPEGFTIKEPPMSFIVRTTPNSKPIHEGLLDEIIEETLNGFEVQRASDEFPMPWDSDWYVEPPMEYEAFAHLSKEGPSLVIVGHAASHGFGSCRVAVPLAKAADAYWFELTPKPDCEEGLRMLLQELAESYGYEVTRE